MAAEVTEEIVGTAQEEMAAETLAESQEAEGDHLLETSVLGVATPVIGRWTFIFGGMGNMGEWGVLWTSGDSKDGLDGTMTRLWRTVDIYLDGQKTLYYGAWYLTTNGDIKRGKQGIFWLYL
jgi:hypothetical protein